MWQGNVILWHSCYTEPAGTGNSPPDPSAEGGPDSALAPACDTPLPHTISRPKTTRTCNSEPNYSPS